MTSPTKGRANRSSLVDFTFRDGISQLGESLLMCHVEFTDAIFTEIELSVKDIQEVAVVRTGKHFENGHFIFLFLRKNNNRVAAMLKLFYQTVQAIVVTYREQDKQTRLRRIFAKSCVIRTRK